MSVQKIMIKVALGITAAVGLASAATSDASAQTCPNATGTGTNCSPPPRTGGTTPGTPTPTPNPLTPVQPGTINVTNGLTSNTAVAVSNTLRSDANSRSDSNAEVSGSGNSNVDVDAGVNGSGNSSVRTGNTVVFGNAAQATNCGIALGAGPFNLALGTTRGGADNCIRVNTATARAQAEGAVLVEQAISERVLQVRRQDTVDAIRQEQGCGETYDAVATAQLRAAGIMDVNVNKPCPAAPVEPVGTFSAAPAPAPFVAAAAPLAQQFEVRANQTRAECQEQGKGWISVPVETLANGQRGFRLTENGETKTYAVPQGYSANTIGQCSGGTYAGNPHP